MSLRPDAGDARLRALALRVQLAGFAGTNVDASTRSLLEEGLGGVCLFATNTADGLPAAAALVEEVRRSRLGAVVAVDEEGGDVTRLHASTGSPFPGHAVLGAADDPAWTRTVGRMIGEELAALGINLVLGPVADVNSCAENPVIGVRSFGPDPARAAAHVAAWVTGVQETGVAACAKHFPGHGDTSADSHLALPQVGRTREGLAERELIPFAAAVQAGAAAVMTGHLVVPALDAALPATLSPSAHGMLRDELGFPGVVVTDALDMAGASAERGIPEAAVLAIAAGADLVCLGTESGERLVRRVQEALVQAATEGRVSMTRLEEAASRVDRLGQRELVGRPVSPVEEVVAAHTERVRRALRVDGVLPRLECALNVLVETEPSIAVGPVPWGLPADLTVPAGAEMVDALTSAHPGRPLVLQVRDAHRHPAVLELVTAAARARETVVVEWGWPGPWRGDAPRVRAYGSSLPGSRAVLTLLEGQGYRTLPHDTSGTGRP